MPYYRVSRLFNRLPTAAVTDRLEQLAEILDKIGEYEVEEHRLPPVAKEVVGELARQGVRFEWPLTVEEVHRLWNQYTREPWTQTQFYQDDEPIGPHTPTRRCEICGEPKPDSKLDLGTAKSDETTQIIYCDDCGFPCEKCRMIVVRDEEEPPIEIAGELYCESCAEDSHDCDDCEERHWDDDLRRTTDGRTLCEECLSENYFVCDSCNEYESDEEMNRTPNDSYMCNDCFGEYYFICGACGESASLTDAHDQGGNTVCADCYQGEGEEVHNEDKPLDRDDHIEFERDIGKALPLMDKLRTLGRLLGEKGRAPVAKLRQSHAALLKSIAGEIDINLLMEKGSITADRIRQVAEKVETPYGGLQVSIGGWTGDQRMYDEDNIVFRLDADDVMDDLRKQGDSAAAQLLRIAIDAQSDEHPVIYGSSIGWLRIVPFEEAEGTVWYIEEVQSDFDTEGLRKFVKTKGEAITVDYQFVDASQFDGEELKEAWNVVGSLLENWEHYLLAKVADIARENGVKNLAIISRQQLDEWMQDRCQECGWTGIARFKCPNCGRTRSLVSISRPEGYDIGGKTVSTSKRKRYYQNLPKEMGFELKETEMGGLPQKVWLRAASKSSVFERAAKHAAFIQSLPRPWELAYGIQFRSAHS